MRYTGAIGFRVVAMNVEPSAPVMIGMRHFVLISPSVYRKQHP
jgi:hypothetical protein